MGRALPPRRCRVLRRRSLRVVGSTLASFGSSAIYHHRLWPRNDLQKSPRARADALGSPRLRQGRRHQRKQPPHYRCQRRTRGQVGDHLLRSGAAGVVTRRAGDGQSALCGRTRAALWPRPHPAAFRPPGPPQGHGRILGKGDAPARRGYSPPDLRPPRQRNRALAGAPLRTELRGPRRPARASPRRRAGHAAHQLRSFPNAQHPHTRRCRRLRPDPTRMYVRRHPGRGLCRRCPNRERARRRVSR